MSSQEKTNMAPEAATTARQQADSRLLQKMSWAVLALLALAYVGFFVRLTSLPYQDFPNHLARAVVMADLIFHHGVQFGQLFDYHFMPVPYVLGDLLLTALVELLGPTLAAALWTTIVLLSLPAALVFHLHVNRVPRDGRVFVLLLSLYLATDWFFLLGFTQFRLGLAVMILAMACADLLRHRWSAPRFLWFCALIVIGYFTHLAAVVFLAPALIISSLVRLWFRSTTLRRELWLIAPVLAILGWHFGFAGRAYPGGDVAAYTYRWGPIGWKLQRLDMELLRIARRFPKVLMIMLAVSMLWGLWRDLSWRTLTKPAVVEMLALAATFLGIYAVLPGEYSDASYVDVRALAPIAVFLILARVYLPDVDASRRVSGDSFILLFAAVLATCNLGWLATYLVKHDAWGIGYREVVARIPRGAYVLPIYTSGKEETVTPRLHMSSFVVTDRGAVIPYLFSGDAGHPMKYFRYKQKLYAPPERWYNAPLPVAVSWQAVACGYQFLLVGKPFDERKIGLRTAPVAENDSAALLAIVPQGYSCDTPPGARQH